MAEAKVDTVSGAYRVMAPRLEKYRALLGGTETMREAGIKFLPQYAAETSKNYRNRLKRAVLYNYFKRTVKVLAGKPFSRELQVKELSTRLEKLVLDADRQGNSLHVWAQEVFEEGLGTGMVGILVDFPENTATNASQESSLAPYFIKVSPESLIAFRTEMVDGSEVVTHARIHAIETEADGRFGEVDVERIYVWETDRVEVWEKAPRAKQFTLKTTKENPLGYVPLLLFYGERQDAGIALSPLNDLADKNIEHWQSSSDQRHILTVARFPMLGAKGVTQAEMDRINLGPQEFLGSENPAGEFYYVEHRGAAIAAGRTDLQDIKADMAVLAMDLMTPKAGRLTATEYAGDQGDASSVLRMLALRFKDLLEQALVVAGDWIGVDPDQCGTVELFTEFELSGVDAKVLDALIAARNSGDLDARTFLEELRRRKILRPDLDLDETIRKGAEELEKAAQAEAQRISAKMKTQTPQEAGSKNPGEKPQE